MDPNQQDIMMFRDGDEILSGGIHLTVVHTPGHTPDHLAYVAGPSSRRVGLVLVRARLARDRCTVDDLRSLTTGHIGVRSECSVRVAGDDTTTCHALDVDVEGVIRRYIAKCLAAYRLVEVECL